MTVAPFAVLFAGSLLAVTSPAADWPCYRGPDRNDTSPETGLARSWPATGPKTLWSHEVENGFGAPSVMQGRVYYLGRDNKAMRDKVHCLDLATGNDLWTYEYYAYGETPYNGRSQPTVNDKHVYTLGPFGDLHCIDKVTGKRVWSLNILVRPRDPVNPTAVPPPGTFTEDKLGIGRQTHPKWGFTQSPLLYGDTVIVAPRSPVTAVVAFDKNTGALKWKSPPSGSLHFTHQTPLISRLAGVDQVVLWSNFHSGPAAVLAGFDALTGAKLWNLNVHKYNIPIPAPIAIGEDRIFSTGGYTVGGLMIKIRNQGGTNMVEKLFENRNCTSMIQCPVFYKGFIYANSFDELHNPKFGITNRGLICMNLKGDIVWETGADHNFDLGNLLIADGMIFIMHGKEGTLHLVEASPEKFNELARTKVFGAESTIPMDAKIWSPMALADGKLVVRIHDTMKCLDVSAVK